MAPAGGRTRLAGAVLVLTTGLVAAACGGPTAASTHAATIQVVTGVYPLAQTVEQIGQGKVAVADVVPPGSDPSSYELNAAQVQQVRHAAVVVLVGGGFQPSLEAAAVGATGVVVNLDSQLAASDPYVWLDPQTMGRALPVIAAALEKANPGAATLYRDGAEAFGDEVASTEIDYESTLSTCPHRTIVTPDGAFLSVAADYDLVDQVVGTAPHPDAALVAAAAARVSAAGLTTVFSEPFADNATIEAVAAGAHVKVRVLDPLTGPPPGGWPSQANYLNLLEVNLGTLSNALGCPNTDNGL